jgi:hypothetical protein
MNNKKDIRIASILFVVQLILFALIVFTNIAEWRYVNSTLLFLTIFAGLPIAYLILNLRALRKPGKKLVPALMIPISGLSLCVLLFIMIWGS